MSESRNALDRDLGSQKMGKLSLKYITPNVITMFINAAWIFIEGIAVGNGIGASGLAALSIAMPVLYLHRAVYFLVGVGGSTLQSISQGKGDYKTAKEYLVQSIVMSWLLSIVLVIFYSLFLDNILMAFGATQGALLNASRTCSIAVLIGFAPAVWGHAIYFNMRADGEPNKASIAMSLGFILAAILDVTTIYVLKLGTMGPGIACVIGETIPGIYFMWYFMKKSSLKLTWKDLLKVDFKKMWRIAQTGFASAGVQITGMIALIIMNKLFMQYYGEYGVSAYGAMMGYIMNFIVLVSMGVAQGIQPIASYNFGAQKPDRVKAIYGIGLKVGLFVGLAGMAVMYLVPEGLANLFISDSAEAKAQLLVGLKYFGMTAPMATITIVVSAYFQALNRNIPANITSLGRTFLFLVPAVFILPKVMGPIGVWAATPVAEIITVVIALWLTAREFRRLGKPSLNNMSSTSVTENGAL